MKFENMSPFIVEQTTEVEEQLLVTTTCSWWHHMLLTIACLGSDLVIANQVMLAGHITIEDYATIGGGAGINQFSRIGRCSYVGGLARITKDVPPYMIVEGTPAEVRAVNIVAMSRRGYPEDQIDAMKEAHKRLFRDNGGSLTDKMAQLLKEFGEHLPVQHLCEAIAASAAGRHGRSNEKITK